MRKFFFVILLVLLFATYPAFGWFDGGHMLVAFIAYKKLQPATRARVDALIRLNPLYSRWVEGVSPGEQGVVAFMRAATWADCIKQSSCVKGYQSDGGNDPPGDPSDIQNIGYADKLMHKYWHFVDEPFSEGAPGQPPKTPNALTEITLLMQAIGTNESDDIKSYDVVWLEHLVGDIHQPLHATSRFTKNHTTGDAGGNFLPLCSKPCTDELHAYWDGLLGDRLDPTQVMPHGATLLRRKRPKGAAEADPKSWVDESFQLAQKVVYLAPISDDNDPSVLISPRPDAKYGNTAVKTAETQALLGGYRLAALLDKNLK